MYKAIEIVCTTICLIALIFMGVGVFIPFILVFISFCDHTATVPYFLKTVFSWLGYDMGLGFIVTLTWAISVYAHNRRLL